MEIRKSFWSWHIFVISIIIALINIGLSSFVQVKLEEQIIQKIFVDVVIIILTGFIGKYFVSKVNFPLWWHRNSSISFKRQLFILAILGIAIIIPNILIYYFNQNFVSTISWLKFSNLKEPILLSLRAGIQEEILFRLFMFTTATYLANKVIDSQKKSVVIGMILSTLIFGVMHGFYFAYISGVLLVYVFYKNGLIPSIIIHFLANAIPWTLLYLCQNSQ